MVSIIYLVYGLLILLFALTCLFIVYHIAKYSINSSVKIIVLPVFIIISVMLILSNIALFLSVDWSDLLFNTLSL